METAAAFLKSRPVSSHAAFCHPGKYREQICQLQDRKQSDFHERGDQGRLPVRMMSKPLSRAYTETFIIKRPEGNSRVAICFFHVPLSLSIDEIEEVWHPQEEAYYKTLKFEKRKRSYLIGRYAAKQAIGAFVQEKNLRSILVEQGVFNQPIVRCGVEHNIQVSITHCDELGAAIAFSEAHPMGIDLQEINANRRDLMESQATEGEKKIMTMLSRPYDMFLTLLWTAKEALSKVLRTGMMTPFTIFEMSTVEIQDDFYVGNFLNFAQYKTISFEIGHHVCSLVVPKKTEMKIDLRALKACVHLIACSTVYKKISTSID